MTHPGGRPPIYSEEILTKAKEYLAQCIDYKAGIEINVKIPTKGGLARYLDVSRETLYAWGKQYPEFSDVMESLGSEQEDRLINNGLAGTYNPTIAKVLLTKHGYREGTEVTGKDGESLFTNEHKDKSDKAINEFLRGDTTEGK